MSEKENPFEEEIIKKERKKARVYGDPLVEFIE
jgi:hypothetical protein